MIIKFSTFLFDVSVLVTVVVVGVILALVLVDNSTLHTSKPSVMIY